MINFIKKEAVLCISAMLALITAFIVPPNSGYIDYINFRVLGLLFALMTVVAGLRKTEVMDAAAERLTYNCKSMRSLAFLLTGLCFFISMFVTNDVALLTFVPLSISVLMLCGGSRYIVYIVVMQTVAANMGSMLTPMGNPQNLYLADFYNLSTAEFFKATVPVWLVSGIIISLLLFKVKNEPLKTELTNNTYNIDKKLASMYLLLGIISVLSVFNVVSYIFSVIAVLILVLLFDRKVLWRVDWFLLLTFVMFFIFVGNAAEIEAVRNFFGKLASGRELVVGAALSQIISNVPAAVMLSSFTDNGTALMIGVDIGGLGTPVASLASLISYRIYKEIGAGSSSDFMKCFLAINFGMLAVLLLFAFVYYT